MRYVPPPFGTGSPSATTRGLEETPYLGSTRLANLFDEAQLARRRQGATAAAPRAIRTILFGRRIPIAPITIPPAVCLLGGSNGLAPRYGPPPHQGMKISQSEQGGNGGSARVVNQWLPRRVVR